jgi:hypothetical protein
MPPRRPKTPLIDLDRARIAFETEAFNRATTHGDLDVTGALKAAREEISDSYDHAKNLNPPEYSAPDHTGLGNVPFYPVSLSGFKSYNQTPASTGVVGRTTPLDFATTLYGPERAQQNAKNLFLRNRNRDGMGGIYPTLGPSFSEHFNRPIHVVRGDEAGRNGGWINPVTDVAYWAKPDDSRIGLAEHEIGGHAFTDFSPYRKGLLDQPNPSGKQHSVMWGYDPNNPVHVVTLKEILLDSILDADPGNVRNTRSDGNGWFADGGLTNTQGEELFENMLVGYHLSPNEIKANGLNWKNEALQIHGQPLAKGAEEIDQMKSFLEAKSDINPKFQQGPRAGQDASNFHFLDLQQKSIYRFLQAADPKKADQYLKLLVRLGAVALPAATELMEQSSDPRRDQ